MKEEYLHYLFRFKLLGNVFTTTDGKEIEILNFGFYNTNAGPDFLEAKICYDGNTWAGPIEFHVKSSDWYLHNHQADERYDNVIAHLVYEHDRDVKSGNYFLPTVELKSKIDENNYSRYCELAGSKKTIPCQNQIQTVDSFLIFQQKEKALINRLIRKSEIILEDIDRLNGDLQKSFYLSMARTFGGKVNQEPFEKLMERFDLNWLSIKTGNEVEIAALLFGLSGMLPKESGNIYILNLINEFNFQKHKFKLKPMAATEWRFSRMHAHGFPTMRIARFAELLKSGLPVSELAEGNFTVNQLRKLMYVQLPEFWNYHYRFENETKRKSSHLSNDFIDILIINTIVPFLFALGVLKDDELLKEKAINLLSEIKTEKNSIIKSWTDLGLKCESAFDSQALIEQKNEFCSKKKCLFCIIGTKLLKS